MHDEMIESVACRVCGKPAAMSPEQCFSSIAQNNPLCCEYGKCRISEKSEEQLLYALSMSTENHFLRACPGSGKTEVVGLKAAYELRSWNKQSCGIAVLTFTNNATDVIRERVDQFAGLGKTRYPHFIGTIDSWLHGYIAQPFGHILNGFAGKDGDMSIRIINDNDSGGWLNNFICKTQYWYKTEVKANNCNTNGNQLTKTYRLASMPIYANMIRYDPYNSKWEIKKPTTKNNEYIYDSEYYELPAFLEFRTRENWMTLDYLRTSLAKAKKSFWAKGFATYQDIEWMCFKLLTEKMKLSEMLAARFPFIIIDECQDLSWIQLQILKALLDNGTKLHLIGDLNQAIYDFKKADPKYVELFVRENGFTTLLLNNNFRSCQPIVDTCQHMINGDNVSGKCEKRIEKACVYLTYKKEDISSLNSRFEKLQNKHNLGINNAAILARNWSTVSKLRGSGHNEEDSYQKHLSKAIYLWGNEDIHDIEDALRCLGKFMMEKYFIKYSCNSRYYYCPECIESPLKWRLFLAKVLDTSTNSQTAIQDLSQKWSDWVVHVRNHFGVIATECLPIWGIREVSG